MTAHYRTLYQCCKCNGILDTSAPTLESVTCSCGTITVKQHRLSEFTVETSVHVKPQDMQPKQNLDPGPYLRRALA